MRNQFSPFGNKLIQAGYIKPDQMQKAIAQSRKTNRPLLEVVESITGKTLPPDLQRQYKKHHLFELKILYGVDSLDPEIDSIENNQMRELIDSLIPVDICRRYKLIPLKKRY